MIRAGFAAGFLAYSALALGSGLDRMAFNDPKAAERVPQWASSFALRARGDAALRSNQTTQMLTIGMAAVNNAPTDPQSTAILGAARYAAGDLAGAEKAFLVAGKLGWRVPATQIYWMNRALQVGDYRVATLRLGALLRQQPAMHRNAALLEPFESIPQARAVLVGRMALRPGWLDEYAGDVAEMPADAMVRRQAVLVELARKGTVLGCSEIAPSVNRLDYLGFPREGMGLWQAHCPAAGASLIGDDGFELLAVNAKASAFAWETLGNGELFLGTEPAIGKAGKRLTIEGNTRWTTPFLSKVRALAPGNYVISWQAGNNEEGPSDKIVASFACGGQQVQWLAARFDAVARRRVIAVTVGENCPRQVLTFGVTGNAGNVWLQDVRLDRAP